MPNLIEKSLTDGEWRFSAPEHASPTFCHLFYFFLLFQTFCHLFIFFHFSKLFATFLLSFLLFLFDISSFCCAAHSCGYRWPISPVVKGSIKSCNLTFITPPNSNGSRNKFHGFDPYIALCAPGQKFARAGVNAIAVALNLMFFLLFLRGSVIPFPIGFCYRQVAILPRLLGITIIISPPYH
jgi:hypothetical protein